MSRVEETVETGTRDDVESETTIEEDEDCEPDWV